MAKRIEIIRNEFNRLENTLDWDIKSKNNIAHTLRTITNELIQLNKRTWSLGQFIHESKNAYAEAERHLNSRLSSLDNLWNTSVNTPLTEPNANIFRDTNGRDTIISIYRPIVPSTLDHIFDLFLEIGQKITNKLLHAINIKETLKTANTFITKAPYTKAAYTLSFQEHPVVHSNPLHTATRYHVNSLSLSSKPIKMSPSWKDVKSFLADSWDYVTRSGEQIIFGNYTDEVTLLGTVGQVGLGIIGVDAPLDIRDIWYDLSHWEWSWKHAGQTGIDMLALVPIIGAFKYSDEAGTLLKSVNKTDDLIHASGKWVKTNEAMSDLSKTYQKQIAGTDMVWLQNGVKFDGFKTGRLIEAKANYKNFINKTTGRFYDWFNGQDSLIDQAIRQINAADGMPIDWYFMDEISMNATKKLFSEEGISGINFILETLK